MSRRVEDCTQCGGEGIDPLDYSSCDYCSGTGHIELEYDEFQDEEEEPFDDNPAEPALNGMWRVGEA